MSLQSQESAAALANAQSYFEREIAFADAVVEAEGEADGHARTLLEAALRAAAESVGGGLLSLECVSASRLACQTVFYVTGFLTEDEEGAESSARVSALLNALPLDRAAVNFIRVTWASGSRKRAQEGAAAGLRGGLIKAIQFSPLLWAGGKLIQHFAGAAASPAPEAAAPPPGFLDEINFHQKHREARAVGAALASVLQRLAADPSAALHRVTLMGHSLGARVVLHALANLPPPSAAPAAAAGGAPGAAAPAPGLQVAAAALFAAAQAGPEDKGEVWAAALSHLPASGALYNCFHAHDPALTAMYTAGRVLGVDGLALRAPAGMRPVALLPAAAASAGCADKLKNIDATPLFAGALEHSFRDVYAKLLAGEHLPCLFAPPAPASV